MRTIHLSDTELAMVRNAMHPYLLTFGHNESEVVERVKSTLAKLDAATEDAATQDAAPQDAGGPAS